jgi:hypothetical protein
MLRSIVTIAGGVLLLGVAASRPARCMDEGEVVNAHVPFAFQVRGTHLPAGDYELKLADMNEPGVVEIRGRGVAGPAVFVLTNAKDSDSIQHAELVFDDVGNQKFLRALLLPGEDGVEVPMDYTEVQAAHSIAAAARQSPPAKKG